MALRDPPGPHGPHGAPLSAQELSQELKAFLSGVDPVGGSLLTPQDQARSALLLLRTLPPARHAALHHLRHLFDHQVCTHLLQRDTGGGAGDPPPPINGGGGDLEEIILEVQKVLGEFIHLNPKSWAPLVSAWSIELMGELSSKYGGRQIGGGGLSPSGGGVGVGGGLNHLLQVWMSCGATRILMEIYTQSLGAMSGGVPDSCVDALLDTSLAHSPHFDWVVAHIGSSFPNTIISRVLSCGLKDFAAQGDPGGTSGGEKKSPKIASVVGILGHLAARHAGSIRQELLKMFHQSLENSPDLPPLPHQKATVPFLLQLARMSPQILGTFAGDLVASLHPPVLRRLQHHLGTFPREEVEKMVNLVVQLICQTSGGGAYGVLRFLLDVAAPPPTPSVIVTPQGGGTGGGTPPQIPPEAADACDRLLHLLLLHLQKLVYNRVGGLGGGSGGLGGVVGGPPNFSDPPPSRPIPFLDALLPHIPELCRETLRSERKRSLWHHHLLGLLGVYAAPHGATQALGYLLTSAASPEELVLATTLHAVLATSLPDLLPSAIRFCVSQIHAGSLPELQLLRFCRNLTWVAQTGLEATEPSPVATMATQLLSLLPGHLPDFSRLLLHPDPRLARAVSHLLSLCPFPPRGPPLPPSHLLPTLRAAVHQFFSLLHPQKKGFFSPSSLASSSRLLSHLSSLSPGASKAALHLLVEGALGGGNSRLFGGSGDEGEGEGNPETPPGVSLLEINNRFPANPNFSGGIWAVFHAGVIGKGLKTPQKKPQPFFGDDSGDFGDDPGDDLGDDSGGWEEGTPQHFADNTQIFLDLLLRCCRGGGNGGNPPNPPGFGVNPEAAKAVAAALVENVCPEATGGDLLWPPEDQTRGNLERDLRICRRFRNQPLLFPLLRLVASGPPALCYCSGLLRGLLASLLAHWDACRDTATSGSPWHLQASCALVSVLAEGSLVPPVLGKVQELFPHLAPFEVRLLLLSLWDYLRENSPLPQKFTFQPQRGVFLRDFTRDGDVGKHLGLLHSLLQKNIHTLGGLATRFRP